MSWCGGVDGGEFLFDVLGEEVVVVDEDWCPTNGNAGGKPAAGGKLAAGGNLAAGDKLAADGKLVSGTYTQIHVKGPYY